MTLDNGLLLVDLATTSAIIGAFLISFFTYTKINKQHSWQSREQTKSTPIFKLVYKPLQFSALFFALSSIWGDSQTVYTLQLPLAIKLSGVTLIALGTSLFMWAIKTLDEQYSPCYDARVPNKIVTTGPYSFLQHPIYVGNGMTLIGMFVSTGAIFVALCFCILLIFYISSAKNESKLIKRLKIKNSTPQTRPAIRLVNKIDNQKEINI